MGVPPDLRAALAALAAAEPDQPGVIYFHEHQGRWRWHPWRWLDEAVRDAEADRARQAGEWPSVEALVAALARAPRLDAAARSAAGAMPPSAAPPPRTGPAPRPIALLAADPGPDGPAAARAWLGWALGAGAALVLPAAPGLLAWSLAWTRPSHAALPVADLPALREALLADHGARALRRRLRRLRHLLVWGGSPAAAETDAWAELGVAPVPWRAE